MNTPPPYIVLFLVITIIAIAAILVLLMILILLNQKRQRSFEERMTTIKIAHEKNIMGTRIEIQEQTLRNIAQEIHDNISLSLTLAKLNLYTVQELPEAKETVDRSLDLIGDAIRDLSAISKSLNSDLISQQGLIRAVQGEVDRIGRSTGLDIRLTITGEAIYLSCNKELFLFRIVQEAFNNVLKHAHARKVHLHLHYENEHVSVSMQDDGKGFEVELMEKGKTAGLSTMADRVRLFNGNFELQSHKQRGTRLMVTLPFNDA